MNTKYKRLNEMYGGVIPFSALQEKTRKKIRKHLSKKRKKSTKKCQCNENFIIEKYSNKKRCAKCTRTGILLKASDNNVYELKNTKNGKKWIKIRKSN